MKFRGVLSFCLSASFAFAGAKPAAIPQENTEGLIESKVDLEAINTHLIYALDEFEAARQAYNSRGQQAFLDGLSDLTKDDRELFKEKTQRPGTMPQLKIENGNTMVAGPNFRAEVLSLLNGATLKINGAQITVPLNGNLRAAYDQIERALNKVPKVAFHLGLIKDAHAGNNTVVILAAVALIAAAFLGTKSLATYNEEKAAKEQEFLPEKATPQQIATFQKKYHLRDDGSRQQSFVGSVQRTLGSFWSSSSTKDKPQSANFYNNGIWAQPIADAIRKLGPKSRMMMTPPSELLKQCTNFMKLNEIDKTRVWTVVMDAISMAESGHNTNDKFVESFGVVSRGMLQISWASARGHRGPCYNATPALLHQAEYNLACGVKIMEDQLAKRNSLFPNPSYYWAVLNPSNRRDFGRLTARLNYLKTVPERWPAECGSI